MSEQVINVAPPTEYKFHGFLKRLYVVVKTYNLFATDFSQKCFDFFTHCILQYAFLAESTSFNIQFSLFSICLGFFGSLNTQN